MNKYIYMCAIALFAITQSYSQCACCAGAGIGSSNGDYNNGILTLPKNNWIIETYGDYRTINGSSADVAAKEEEEETRLNSLWIQSIGARYGITDNISVSALMPYVFLHTDTGNDKGLGDLILMGTFNVFNKNNFSLALQAGVELPTGIQKDATFDNTTVVVGSGSYDPIGGVIVSKRWSKFYLQANGLYKHTTNGFQGNYYGSIAIQNVSLNYRILGENSICAAIPVEKSTATETAPKPASSLGWNVFGGYYGEWLDKLEEDNVVDENSGYYLGYATMGTNLSYATWSFPLTLSLPIIQNMNGDQNDGGFRIRLGIVKSF